MHAYLFPPSIHYGYISCGSIISIISAGRPGTREPNTHVHDAPNIRPHVCAKTTETSYLVSALLLGGTLGAQLGARTGQQWGGIKLRERFGWLLLTSACLIAYKLLRMLYF